MPRHGSPACPACRGDGRARHPNTITALKNAQLAQSPVGAPLGGAAPTALQGRGALQDIDQRPLVGAARRRFFKMQRLRDLGPAVGDAFALARSGVPGPVFIECPVDLLYDEASVRQWYAEAAGKGNSLSRACAALVPQPPCQAHVRRQPGCAGAGRADGVSTRTSDAPLTRRWRASQDQSAADGDRCASGGALGAKPIVWRKPCSSSACRCTCRAWRAAPARA